MLSSKGRENSLVTARALSLQKKTRNNTSATDNVEHSYQSTGLPAKISNKSMSDQREPIQDFSRDISNRESTPSEISNELIFEKREPIQDFSPTTSICDRQEKGKKSKTQLRKGRSKDSFSTKRLLSISTRTRNASEENLKEKSMDRSDLIRQEIANSIRQKVCLYLDKQQIIQGINTSSSSEQVSSMRRKKLKLSNASNLYLRAQRWREAKESYLQERRDEHLFEIKRNGIPRLSEGTLKKCNEEGFYRRVEAARSRRSTKFRRYMEHKKKNPDFNPRV